MARQTRAGCKYYGDCIFRLLGCVEFVLLPASRPMGEFSGRMRNRQHECSLDWNDAVLYQKGEATCIDALIVEMSSMTR